MTFKSRVSVIEAATQQHVFAADSETAEWMCRTGLAVQVLYRFSAFIAVIELTRPLDEVKQHMAIRKGRPRMPLRAPDSSTGDAGRGLGPLIGRYRALHFGPGIRV